MAYPVYPTTPTPYKVYASTDAFKTLLSDYQYGNEQRFAERRFSKRQFKLQYRVNVTNRDILHALFRSRKGRYDSFWFFDFKQRKWTDEYVGYGNNSTKIFDLHSKSTVAGSVTVYVNDSPVTATLLTGGGTGDSDRVELDAAPAWGALITSDFTGLLRIRGRFDNDEFEEDMSAPNLFFININVAEIHW